jgi:type VI secretion system secreted protein Hcp
MAAQDYFLKLAGIPGESLDDKHKDEIDILSWSWGCTQSGTMGAGGGGGAGKVTFADISFTAKLSKASPKLALACCTGEHITTPAILTCRKAGKDQQEYLTYKLTDFLISSYHTSGGGGSDIIPTDTFSINFGKLEMSYKHQTAGGTLGGAVNMHYSIETNKGA